MLKSTGYFLAEILISLLLCASIALLLLKQQWQLSKYICDIETRLQILNNSENKYERSLQGFSLSEVLICLLLASLVLTGLIKQYAQVYRQDSILNSRLEQTSDLQLVGELLRNSLRRAGFTPCGNLDDLQNESNSELSAVKFISNSIEIAHMSENYFEFSSKVDALQFLNKKTKLQQFMITDCFHAVVVTNDKSSLGWNAVLNFIESNFIQPIYIGEYVNERFWIKDGKNFYYKFKHSEKLSDYIKSMETSWLENNIVQVKFILMDESVQKILVKVRNKT
jgi:type II secretory pathway component PulJ